MSCDITPQNEYARSMTSLQNGAIAFALVVAVAAAIYEARQAATARGELLALQQQQTPAGEQIQQWQHEQDNLIAQVAELKRSPDFAELSQLRNEAARLRDELKDLPANRAQLLRQKLAQMPEKAI